MGLDAGWRNGGGMESMDRGREGGEWGRVLGFSIMRDAPQLRGKLMLVFITFFRFVKSESERGKRTCELEWLVCVRGCGLWWGNVIVVWCGVLWVEAAEGCVRRPLGR